MKNLLAALLSLLVLITAPDVVAADSPVFPELPEPQWPVVERPEIDPIQDITRYTPSQLDFMAERRRSGNGCGQVWIPPEAFERAHAVQGMLAKDGPEAVAKHILKIYPTEKATTEMQGVAIGLLTRFNYFSRYGVPWGKDTPQMDGTLYGPKNEKGKHEQRPEELTKTVNAIVDAILQSDAPHKRNAAIETLLQVFSEGLGSQHVTSDNGGRKIPELPRELTIRAGEFLGDADPFVLAMADWAISVNVGNENEGRHQAWPGDPKPEWWDAWLAIPESRHLDMDYVRQIISLQMHRHPEDLLTVSKDQMRRAEAKAAWAKLNLDSVAYAEIETKIQRMHNAHKKFADVIAKQADDITACRKAFLEWRPTVRAVAMSGPDMNFDQLVYLTRYSGGQHLQPGIHNVWNTMGGDIYVQDGFAPDAPRRALIGDKMPKGFTQDLDIWYDADKIVFSRTNENGVLQLYEIDLQGNELVRVTDGPYHDEDPAYVPDGSIVYGSKAAEAGTMCASALGHVGKGGASHTNIFRVSADHKEVRRISYCKDDDCYPAVLDDGRVMWLRWDYQERGVNEIFSLWSMRPDGTGSDAFFRVHIPEDIIIQTLRDPQGVPGTEKIVAAGGGHYSGLEGTLVLADTSLGINNPLAIRTVTPYISPHPHGSGKLIRSVEEGGVPYPGGYVVKPYPLSEKSFLAGMGFDMPTSCNFWLYYIDAWGNKELIRRERLMEIATVRPVRKRKKPPILPDLTDPSKTYATCYVDNVYTDLPGVEKGEVKYLRIAQQMFWPTRVGTQGLQYHPLANASECFGYPGTGGPVRVVGLVPVEEDGSAYFEAPADIDLYFQALDKDYRAVQRMRTHVKFGRGENRSCVGCHETKDDVPPTRQNTIALSKMAVRPTPPPWGDTTLINYETMIQPIFDKKCIKCHGPEKPKADLNLSSAKDKYGFMQGYRSMFGLKPDDPTPNVVWNYDGWVKKERAKIKHPWYDIMNNHIIVRSSLPARIAAVADDAIPNFPKRYGAIRHPLVWKLTGEGKHAELLSDEEKQLLMTWFDIQSPYFDTYMQQAGHNKKDLQRVKVDPYPPFGDSREHTVHRPDEE